MLRIVASGTYIDEIYAKGLQFADEEFALLKTPIPPFAVLALFRTFGPIGGADAYEQWLLPCLAYTLYDLQGEPQAILE